MNKYTVYISSSLLDNLCNNDDVQINNYKNEFEHLAYHRLDAQIYLYNYLFI